MPRNKEAVRKAQEKYRGKKRQELAEKAKVIREYKKQTDKKLVDILFNRLSEQEQQQIKPLIDAEKFQEAKRALVLLQYQKREKQVFNISNFKHQLVTKYVHSDPEYLKLTQEGQAFYEKSFLAFLNFLQATHDLEFLKQSEDKDVLSKIDVYHKEQAKEIMAELDQFLNKYLGKPTKEVEKRVSGKT